MTNPIAVFPAHIEEEQSFRSPSAWLLRAAGAMAPKNLVLRARRLIREDDVARAVFNLMLAPDRKERDLAAERLMHFLLRRELQQVVEPSSAKGFAKDLLENPSIRSGLEGTMHLGALHPLSLLKATRLEYVELTLAILLEMKQRYPGLGLGSPVTEWHQRGTGLELAQTWAILHSWGHLFGTFATERALLFALERDSELENLLRRQTHESLRSYVERTLGSRDLYRAYYALGSWRASTELQNRQRMAACDAFRLFFEWRKQQPAPMLYRAYKSARQLAYHRLHSYQQLGATCDFSKAADAVRWIMAEPELVLDQGARTAFAELLDQFDAFQSQEIFTTPKAAGLVLAHVRAFKRWWGTHRGQHPPDKLIRELTSQPSDWPSDELSQLEHWQRIRLPSPGGRWTSEVREWLQAGEWEHGNFLLSPTPAATGLICDVYANAGRSPAGEARLLHSVASRLAAHCKTALAHPQDAHSDLWRSVSLIGLRALSRVFRPRLIATVEPAEAETSAALHALVLDSPASVRDELGRLIPRLLQKKRKDELNAVRDAIAGSSEQGFWLVFLGTVRLTDCETGKQHRELDGVWAKILPSSVEWNFLEQKAPRQGGVFGQLTSLPDDLQVSASPVERSNTGSGKASRCKCTWPQ